MKILSWEDLTAGRGRLDRPVDITIGAFDGIHLGHRTLLCAIASRRSLTLPLVITFRRKPSLVLGNRPFPGLLLSDRQKLERLESLAVGAVVIVDFSEELSTLSGKAFVGLLKENLAIRRIVVGHDFRFGKDRGTDADGLTEMLCGTGIEVLVLGPVLHRGSVVSSSRIRKSIQEAAFAEAREMLLADYALDLRSVAVERRGPLTARIARSALAQVLPADGRYDVRCSGEQGGALPGQLEIDGDSLVLSSAAAGPTEITFAFE
jgi:riboflavin kinase / FMN adenylyltransferase